MFHSGSFGPVPLSGMLMKRRQSYRRTERGDASALTIFLVFSVALILAVFIAGAIVGMAQVVSWDIQGVTR